MSAHQLFISNLPSSITQPQLTQMFSNFSSISTVGLFKDQNKIVGYIDFMDARQAESARQAFDGWSGFNSSEPLKVTASMPQDPAYKRARDDYEPIPGAQPLKQQRGANGMGLPGGYQMGAAMPEGPMTQQGMPTIGAMSGYTSGTQSYPSHQSNMHLGATNGTAMGGPIMPQHQHQQMDGTGGYMGDTAGMHSMGMQPPMQQQPPMQAPAAHAPIPGARPPPYMPNGLSAPAAARSNMPRPVSLPPPAGGPMLGGAHTMGGGMGTMGGALQQNGMGTQMGGMQQNGMGGQMGGMQQSGMGGPQMGQMPIRPPAVPPAGPPPMAAGLMGPRPPPVPPMQPPMQLPMQLPLNAVNTVHIDVLPNDVTKRELAHIFRQYEGYRHTRIVQKDSTKRKGDKITMAFIEFTTAQQATYVMNKLQGYVFDQEEEGSLALKLSYAKPHTKPQKLYQ